ncbi:MAG: hypothetical protein A2X34_06490 [Elusimicrobia bacterium GWC2_51_8]|nr:MAG: hypothetical protein A2X33_07340 [Elusimicrobia bacterium GWA2_51_34]OGR61904.1 MAG: hypothetical protein A2X34_06490 [Elusimicrobia bacterium GWC2_51_8]OGR85521.1 MAG: hypothetical protein A2021_02400 [Elusimicrobia bacterium GWF2_52_66]HAF95286.1 hypothetical protein [Elusimicrobiota bacterium]HCE96942.1 hypothetical protein [Elusimicrobiota bacterium]
MNARWISILGLLGGIIGLNASGQETSAPFHPIALWESNASKGVLLVAPGEMLIIDSKGDKYGKVHAKEPVYGATISPDGKKLVYITATGLWLAKLESGANYLVSSGVCGFFHWNVDGLSFLFSVDERGKDAPSSVSSIKFFWADGDGKNLKQVYP